MLLSEEQIYSSTASLSTSHIQYIRDTANASLRRADMQYYSFSHYITYLVHQRYRKCFSQKSRYTVVQLLSVHHIFSTSEIPQMLLSEEQIYSSTASLSTSHIQYIRDTENASLRRVDMQ
jgi:hypothetical protein